MRPASIDAAAGSVEEVSWIVAQIRNRWPKVRILLRADRGFARDDLMAWCEASDVHFVFGFANNDRLVGELKVSSQRPRRRAGEPIAGVALSAAP